MDQNGLGHLGLYTVDMMLTGVLLAVLSVMKKKINNLSL